MLKKTINPDIIFTHSRKSLHQSHITLAEETERIMRNNTILFVALLLLSACSGLKVTQHYDEAVSNLEYILMLDSANLNSLMMLGDILSRKNDSSAIVYYERAFEIYPENQKVAYALENWYIQAKYPDKAVPVCEQILQKDSTNIKFHKLLGLAYYKMGDPGTLHQTFPKGYHTW